MYAINVVLLCNIGITSVLVSCNDLGDTDMLIGMDIITKGDFSITNVDGKTVCSFRVPSIKTIDYVKESELLEKYTKIHTQWIKSAIARLSSFFIFPIVFSETIPTLAFKDGG